MTPEQESEMTGDFEKAGLEISPAPKSYSATPTIRARSASSTPFMGKPEIL
jgi:hypothetical protein